MITPMTTGTVAKVGACDINLARLAALSAESTKPLTANARTAASGGADKDAGDPRRLAQNMLMSEPPSARATSASRRASTVGSASRRHMRCFIRI